MATDAFIHLDRLTCRRESDGSGHSEPYIWPMLVYVDDRTFATPERVGITGPALGNARVELKDGMRAGDQVGIPASVGQIRVRFEDNLQLRQMILAVVLWESDETPKAAMEAGFIAYGRELRAAVGQNLLALNATQDDPEQRKVIVDEIKARIRKAVEGAIENRLTAGQKVRIAIGSLNLDDEVGSDFLHIAELAPRTIHLTFRSSTNVYDIDGRVRTVRVLTDICQSRVDAVKAAQTAVNGVEIEIAALQKELQSAPPGLKPFITAQINQLRSGELVQANAALNEARRALQRCRDQDVKKTGTIDAGKIATK